MNAFIETLNLCGDRALRVAWPLLWQSSLLIAVLFALDYALRRKIRAAVRYALWLVVLVKLLLPPSLALPTGLAWWVRPVDEPVAQAPRPQPTFVVTYGNLSPVGSFPVAPTKYVPPSPRLSRAAWMFLGWAATGAGLLGWLVARWWQVARTIRQATPAPDSVNLLFVETQCQAGALLHRPSWTASRPGSQRPRPARHTDNLNMPARFAPAADGDRPRSGSSVKMRPSQTGMRGAVRMRLTDRAMSPAVCGLFRPIVLLPRSLTEQLPPDQLRAVLLHELIHLRRADVWVNCAQALLQIVYWWHPLLWLANARIRRVREEAVDDAVMLALRDGAETYAPTLLEVAKLAFDRPLASLGLVGILESRSALHQRIERLMDFRPPRRAGLTVMSALCVVAFGALAAPMGQAPPPAAAPTEDPAATVDASSPTNIETKIFRVGTNALFARFREETGLGTNEEIGDLGLAWEKLFSRLGFDPKAPGRVFWFKDQGMLLARATPGELAAVERLIISLNQSGAPAPGTVAGTQPAAAPPIGTGSAASLVQDGRLLYEMGKFDEAEAKLKQATSLDPQNKAALYYLSLVKEARYAQAEREQERNGNNAQPRATRTNLTFTSKGRQTIVTKLDRIRLDSAGYDGMPLSEVVRNLSIEVKRLDPEGRGINFLINPNARPLNTATIDPVTGLPAPAPPSAETRAIGALVINISPALGNARLVDVLDAIVKGADKPIHYSIQDYAIVFSPREPGEPLETRVFKLDPRTFSEGLKQAGVLISGFTNTTGQNGDGGSTITAPRVNVSGGGGSGSGGLRFVTRTNSSGQVSLAVRNLFSALGVNLDPTTPGGAGKSVFYNDRGNTLFVRATAKDLDIIEEAIQVLNTAPYQVNIKARFVEMDTSQALGLEWYLGNLSLSMTNVTNLPEPGSAPAANNPNATFPLPAGGLRADSPAACLTGILTEPQFQVVLKALEQREMVDEIAAPEVTTLSGRQAQIQVVNMQSILLGINPKALIPPGVAPADGTNGLYRTPEFPLGPVLDVIPIVSADGYSIQMTVIPTVTEFLGYDKTDKTVPVYVNGQQQTVPLPLPRFRVRQTTNSAIVWDGQTLVLANLPATEVSTGPDGKQQTTTARDPIKKQIIVFVTPTIIDPAGNRLHSDDQTPLGH